MTIKKVALGDDTKIIDAFAERGQRIDSEEQKAQKLAEKDLAEREKKLNKRDLPGEGKPPVA